ncbi:IS21 family transposase, partial [Mesorhizobium sp. M1334]
RMKTAVIGEGDTGGIVYNRALVDLARHYGFHPKACRPYRAKTKGKVERPFRYIREDFFLARSFRNLEDLNAQLRHWLDTVANPRVHATTRRVVNEAFAEERAALRPLPLAPFRSVLKLERRISREGMVSVGGNFYSVPDATRRRVVEVHTLAEEVRIFEDGALIATHPILEGRHQRHVEPGHRNIHVHKRRQRLRNDEVILHGSGDRVAQRPLAFYDAVARVMAKEQRP